MRLKYTEMLLVSNTVDRSQEILLCFVMVLLMIDRLGRPSARLGKVGRMLSPNPVNTCQQAARPGVRYCIGG